MALIKHNALDGGLAGLDKDVPPNAVLICGEPFLVRKAFDSLTAVLLKGLSREFSLETLDGKITPVGDVIEQVSTFSFLQSRKVIALKDAPLFIARAPAGEIAYSKKEMDHLANLVEKGIPDHHILIFTSGAPDKRKKIYKKIQDTGLVIDCTVAQGARKADLDEQQAVLRELGRQLLSGTNKQLEPQAFMALVDQTGFNPEIFSGNIEKLLSFTGARSRITVQDVQAVVNRDKKEPIFNLTNAVMDRNVPQALTLLHALFTEGFHPLQILKTLENQLRKLLAVKSFVTRLYASNPGLPPIRTMHFNGFKQVMLPRITAADQENTRILEEWENLLAPGQDSDTNPNKKKPISSDLLLAPNPKNPYPVFQNFQKSENFTLTEIQAAVIELADLDYALKTSGIGPNIGIENFIMNLCQKGG